MNSALFATRVDAFEDASEGAVGHENVTFTSSMEATLKMPPRFYVNETGQHALPQLKENLIHAARRHTAVTCWFRYEEVESFPMWRVYGGDSFAVAIATTVGALREAFAGAPGIPSIGAVVYGDLPANVSSVATLFFHKRPEYALEREIRSIQVFPDVIDRPYFINDLSPGQVNSLLREVVAAPLMRDTMYQTILATIKSRFSSLGLAFDDNRLRRSSLDKALLR